jgi:hypothetical protein
MLRDAITAGTLKAVPFQYPEIKLEVTPQYDTKTRETTFLIRGNVDEALQKISENALVGSRDVLEGIKAAVPLFTFSGEGRDNGN